MLVAVRKQSHVSSTRGSCCSCGGEAAHGGGPREPVHCVSQSLQPVRLLATLKLDNPELS